MMMRRRGSQSKGVNGSVVDLGSRRLGAKTEDEVSRADTYHRDRAHIIQEGSNFQYKLANGRDNGKITLTSIHSFGAAR